MYEMLIIRMYHDRLYASRKEGGSELASIETREMFKKFKFDLTNKWYIYNPAAVLAVAGEL